VEHPAAAALQNSLRPVTSVLPGRRPRRV